MISSLRSGEGDADAVDSLCIIRAGLFTGVLTKVDPAHALRGWIWLSHILDQYQLDARQNAQVVDVRVDLVL